MSNCFYLINNGRYLPDQIKSNLAEIFDYVCNNVEFIRTIDESFSVQNIEVKKLKPGNHTILVLHLIGEGFQYILKVFDLKFQEIIHHILTLVDFENIISNPLVTIENISINFRLLDCYGTGIIGQNNLQYPILVQEYSGEQQIHIMVKENSISKSMIKEVFKNLASKGFVFDPSPPNFRGLPELKTRQILLEYLDLIFFKDEKTKLDAHNYTLQLLKGILPNKLFEKYY